MSFEHTLDQGGRHYEEECYVCLLKEEVRGDCRCGECCRRLLIEATLEDAEREPTIKKRGSPIFNDQTASGRRELEGYYLNARRDGACTFLDRRTNLGTIYDTRPLVCRLFDCAGEGREQLIELGVRLPARPTEEPVNGKTPEARRRPPKPAS